jgi:ABC-type Zn2+ transport system substrate-binding protein/surface adhesin
MLNNPDALDFRCLWGINDDDDDDDGEDAAADGDGDEDDDEDEDEDDDKDDDDDDDDEDNDVEIVMIFPITIIIVLIILRNSLKSKCENSELFSKYSGAQFRRTFFDFCESGNLVLMCTFS